MNDKYSVFIKKLDCRFPKRDYVIVGEYKDNKTPILLKTKYGMCKMAPSNLLMGRKPMLKSAVDKNAYSISQFIEVHGLEYDYSLFEFINSKTPSTIICKKHGPFNQTPDKHLHKRGCAECGVEKNTITLSKPVSEFIKQSINIHGDKYDYNNVIYKNSSTHVIIKCNGCGEEFLQRPEKHLTGQGCSYCNSVGLKRNKFIELSKGIECLLYVVNLYNEHENFYKIGITKFTVKKRFSGNLKMPYNFELLLELKSTDAGYIWDLEHKLKQRLAKQLYIPIHKFGGSVKECFSNFESISSEL